MILTFKTAKRDCSRKFNILRHMHDEMLTSLNKRVPLTYNRVYRQLNKSTNNTIDVVYHRMSKWNAQRIKRWLKRNYNINAKIVEANNLWALNRYNVKFSV